MRHGREGSVLLSEAVLDRINKRMYLYRALVLAWLGLFFCMPMAVSHAQAPDNTGQGTSEQLITALNNAVREAQTNPTPELAESYSATFQHLMEQGEAQLRPTPDRAREIYKALYSALANEAGRRLFMQGPGGASYQQAASQVVSGYAEANALLARRISSNVSMRKQVQDLYAEAVSLTQRQNNAYLLGLGDAARINSDMETAFQAFKTVVENPSANRQQVADAREGLAKIATATGNRLVMPSASATPPPVNAVTVTPQPGTAPTPAVPAVPGASGGPALIPLGAAQGDGVTSGPARYDFPSIVAAVKDGTIFSKSGDIARQYITPNFLAVLGALVAVYVVFWFLPYQILKLLARRGDYDAGNRLLRAKRLGFLALLAYGYGRYARARDTRHRCPFCNKGIDKMEDYRDLNFVVCPHCREPITPIYNMNDYVDHLVEQLKLSQKSSSRNKRGGDVLIEKDAMLKLVRGVLAMCIRRRASDFHLETHNDGGHIRARIDGIMYDLKTLPREITPAFISALKVMAHLDITERRIPQDGKIPLWIDNMDFDLRINTSPASMGEKVVIRILRQDSINITPEKLGLEGENLAVYDRNIRKPHGVIIVTGPSGSGKSTSLYVALNQLNNGDKNIITIEDPIEYHLQGLSQMQVNPAANFTFATGLRSILRQDPDVIMVGEIRDKETAEAALDAAMTGHTVLTTLHTIDAPTAFSRMKDLGIDQARIASAVNLVIAQRLVRTVCPDCRKTYKPKPADIERLGLEKEDDITYVHGTGCETCMNTGYYGRLAIFEMLEMNDRVRSLLELNSPTTAVREAARDFGMRSLREEGLRLVRNGVTTVEEVIRVTTS